MDKTNKNHYVDLINQQLSEDNLIRIVHAVTGHIYTFACSSSMRWGVEGEIKQMGDKFPDGFYQLMPDTMDDGFFDWYCYHRNEQQFFETPETATLQFIYYWKQWEKLGKPKAF